MSEGVAAFSVLAIAVASGKVGYVFLSDGRLQDWGTVIKAARSTGDLVEFAQRLIIELRPDVVVTEKCGEGCRKGRKAPDLIQSLAALASHNMVLDVSVNRLRAYASKYDEAVALTDEFPALQG